MILRTLGGLSLEGAGFHRPKPLLLLAYLALEGTSDRRRVAEIFWPHAANARRSLNMALTQLRAGGPGIVASDGARVSSNATCDAVGLLRAVEQRDWFAVIDTYRGPFLQGAERYAQGIQLEEWLFGTREVLAHAVRGAFLALAEAAAADARVDEAGSWATRARGLDDTAPPEPDDLARTYALLLASGRSGIHAMRAEGEALGLTLPASKEAARRSLTAAPPAPSGAWTLPSPTGELVGRQQELTRLRDLLVDGEARLLALVGAGGTGKTRLALQVATDEARTGAWRGVHVVALETVRNADQVAGAIGAQLGLDLPDGGDHDVSLRQLRTSIGSDPRLMVLDNFEQVHAAGPFLAELLRACQGLRLVVTSRMRLDLDDEHVLPVEGLPLPAAAPRGGPAVAAERALAFDAVRLFVLRARRARADFVPGEADLAAVARICGRVDGMPLALEMAAAWVRVLSCAEIDQELAQGFDLLERDNRDGPTRHRSMRVVFDHSWRILSREAQRGAMALSVFRGGFGREAASRVAGVSLAQLASLVDRSLLSWDGAARYHLHPLFQRFLEDRARQAPTPHQEVEERHARYYLEKLEARRQAHETPRVPTPDPGRSAVDIEVDLANVLAAWAWAASHGRHELLEDAVNSVGWYFLLRGRPQQGLDWNQPVEGVGPDTLLALRQTLWRAESLKELGRLPEAMACIQRAVRLSERRGALPELAHALRLAGFTYLRFDPPDQARVKEVYGRSLALYRELGFTWGEALMLGNLGYEYDDPDEALAMVHEGLALARHTGVSPAKALNLGYVAKFLVYCKGEYDAARAAAQESIACHEALGFDFHLAHTLLTLGDVHLAAGAPSSAEAEAGRVLELCARMQGDAELMVRGGAHALHGHARWALGDAPGASAHYHRVLDLLRDAGRNETTVWAAGMSLDGLARIALAARRPAEARAHTDEAWTLVRDFSVHGTLFLPAAIELVVPLRRGQALVLEGDLEGAEGQLSAALDRARERKRTPATLEALEALAELRRRQGRSAEAERLLRVVAAHPASPSRLARRAEAILEELAPYGARGDGDAELLAATLESVVQGAKGV